MYIKINGKKIKCSEGQTVMQIARENGIFIPGLCEHPDFEPKGNCRICVVEVKGRNRLATSCELKAEKNMEIITDSERVKKARNLNIELIFAEHVEKCPKCVWNVNCALLDLAEKYKINIKRFTDRKPKRKTYKFANAIEIDGTQCIDCRNCIDACAMQNINFLEAKGKGVNQEIVPVSDKKKECILCGQCAVHCPIGSAQEQTQWEEVEKKLKNKINIKVAQFAPAVRVSIGEEFGMSYGEVTTGKIVAGLKQLGFDYVFDVNFGADITTLTEADELIKRIKNKETLPLMTSCCPAWVRYVEFYHPELIPNLTTARSPQIHNGGLIKTYWAEKMKANPKNISVVSIMPCTSKKFEATREELKINGQFPVDNVLTVREFAYLLKKHNIDFRDLKPEISDSILSEFSGAAAIYGGSGGVMESALRTAAFILKGNKKLDIFHSRIDFKEVRGLAGIKEAKINLGGNKLRVAVVNGIGNIDNVLKKIDDYDYIEVMACPGGCIGGGGQPIPTTDKIRLKRIEALYKLDKNTRIRKAHENKEAVTAIKWLKSKGKLEGAVLHTSYKKRK